MTPGAPTRWDRLLLALVLLDAVVLAALELLFLPLRVRDLTDGAPEWSAGWPVPLSILAAAISGPLLVAAASRLTHRPIAAASPLLVWMLAALVIGAFGPGGDVLLLNDWRSVALLAAGTLPGALVLGRMVGTAISAQTGKTGDRPDQSRTAFIR